LEQGKRTKTSYRMKKHYYKPREEWSVHESNHEAVINPWDFELVQELMSMDTRITPDNGMTNMFSGFVVCGHCGRPMIVKTTKKPNGAKYINYICSTHKKYGTCQNNNASAMEIEKFTLLSVQNQMAALIDADEIFGGSDLTNLKTRKQTAVESMIDRNMQTVRENRNLLVKCYEHFNGDVITESEYRVFRETFNTQIIEAENNIAALREEIKRIEDSKQGMEHIERFRQYGNIPELSRRIIATLIKSIAVFGGKEFQITFRYAEVFSETASEPEKAVI